MSNKAVAWLVAALVALIIALILYFTSDLFSKQIHSTIAVENKVVIGTIKIGMTMAEVEKLMPADNLDDGADAVSKRNALYGTKKIDIWLYHTNLISKSATADTRYTPVVFVDGKVVGTDVNFYNNLTDYLASYR